MFQNATDFNQDLSGWNVENIPSKPQDFDTGATRWTNASWRPQWGTDGAADVVSPVITLLGDLTYFSQFGEPIESGSSADRPGVHTGFSNTDNDFVTGFSEPSDVDCSDLVTYAQALDLVEAAGARLPTLQELQANVTKATGCGHGSKLLWTQTVGDNTGERWVDTGDFANSAPVSRSETAEAYVSYVYDNAPLLATVSVLQGDSYTDAGATATDNFDGDLTSSIAIGGEKVDTSTPGTYIVT